MDAMRIPDRVALYARDVQNITGRSPRTCQRIIQRIRQFYGKTNQGFVTREEFCAFCQISEDVVRQYLKL
jgi:hypothetical protein